MDTLVVLRLWRPSRRNQLVRDGVSSRSERATHLFCWSRNCRLDFAIGGCGPREVHGVGAVSVEQAGVLHPERSIVPPPSVVGPWQIPDGSHNIVVGEYLPAEALDMRPAGRCSGCDSCGAGGLKTTTVTELVAGASHAVRSSVLRVASTLGYYARDGLVVPSAALSNTRCEATAQ